MNPARFMDNNHTFGQHPNNFSEYGEPVRFSENPNDMVDQRSMMGGSRMNQEMYEDGMDSRDGRAGGNFDRFTVGGGEGARGTANALGPMFTIGSQGPGNARK